MKFLTGKKTYIATGLLFITGGMKALGVLEETGASDGIMGMLEALAIAALRLGVKKVE